MPEYDPQEDFEEWQEIAKDISQEDFTDGKTELIEAIRELGEKSFDEYGERKSHKALTWVAIENQCFREDAQIGEIEEGNLKNQSVMKMADGLKKRIRVIYRLVLHGYIPYQEQDGEWHLKGPF